MSEPASEARTLEPVVAGIWHWHLDDDRIGNFISAASAIESEDGAVLIDPLPLAASELGRLGEVCAIVLTSGSHQRSAWRLRPELSAAVYAPELSQTLEEEPDVRYGDDDLLPGGLRAIFTPGAGTTQHTLIRERDPRVAFVPDMLARPVGAPLMLVPAEFQHDPAEGRRSTEKLLELDFSVLCLAHGTPVVSDPHGAIREALDR